MAKRTRVPRKPKPDSAPAFVTVNPPDNVTAAVIDGAPQFPQSLDGAFLTPDELLATAGEPLMPEGELPGILPTGELLAFHDGALAMALHVSGQSERAELLAAEYGVDMTALDELVAPRDRR